MIDCHETEIVEKGRKRRNKKREAETETDGAGKD